jgi:hypothetical protein
MLPSLTVQVLQNLQRTRTRILVVGDSMQKQLHGRIIHMFRGSRHPIDNRIFTVGAEHTFHAQHAVPASHSAVAGITL